MQIKIINVPITDDGTAQHELNRFLAANRVLEVEQRSKKRFIRRYK